MAEWSREERNFCVALKAWIEWRDTVDIVTGGTIRADVTSPDGYFVVLTDLPVEASPPPSPPPLENVFQRIDAYAADGTLLGTGGLSGLGPPTGTAHLAWINEPSPEALIKSA